MWPFTRKQTYTKEVVELIISDILRQTVDRCTVRCFLQEDISPLLGEKLVETFFAKINDLEKKADVYQLDYWMKKLELFQKEIK